jgi:hypothetical protein
MALPGAMRQERADAHPSIEWHATEGPCQGGQFGGPGGRTSIRRASGQPRTRRALEATAGSGIRRRTAVVAVLPAPPPPGSRRRVDAPPDDGVSVRRHSRWHDERCRIVRTCHWCDGMDERQRSCLGWRDIEAGRITRRALLRHRHGSRPWGWRPVAPGPARPHRGRRRQFAARHAEPTEPTAMPARRPLPAPGWAPAPPTTAIGGKSGGADGQFAGSPLADDRSRRRSGRTRWRDPVRPGPSARTATSVRRSSPPSRRAPRCRRGQPDRESTRRMVGLATQSGARLSLPRSQAEVGASDD